MRHCVPMFALVALLLNGCARDPSAPVPSGQTCDSQADCNLLDDGGVMQCGRLRLCIDGYCEVDRQATEAGEAVGSRIVTCKPR